MEKIKKAKGRFTTKRSWIFGAILGLFLIGLVLAQNVEMIVEFFSEINIPLMVDAGKINLGEEFKWAEINVTSAGPSSWVILTWKNSTGPMTNTSVWIKDSTGKMISSHFYLDEPINVSVVGGVTYSIYARGGDIGRVRAYLQVRCPYCNVSQNNKIFSYNQTIL